MTSHLLEFKFCAHYFIENSHFADYKAAVVYLTLGAGLNPLNPLKRSRRTSQEAEQQGGEVVEVGAALYHYAGALRCRDDSVGQSGDCRRPGDVTTNYFSLCMENSSRTRPHREREGEVGGTT